VLKKQKVLVFAKQIQWEWPEIYCEDRFVVMFGGLHIQMAAFKLLVLKKQKVLFCFRHTDEKCSMTLEV
jgi:hypothetical protein